MNAPLIIAVCQEKENVKEIRIQFGLDSHDSLFGKNESCKLKISWKGNVNKGVREWKHFLLVFNQILALTAIWLKTFLHNVILFI